MRTKEENIDGYLRFSEENGLGFSREDITGFWDEGGRTFEKLHKVYVAYCEAFGHKPKDLEAFTENIQTDFVTSFPLGADFEPWTKLFIGAFMESLPDGLVDVAEEGHE